MTKLPRHIAIVMDGNGRWARARNLPRVAGHRAGGEAAKEIIRTCVGKKISVLTLFAFGYENWQRPEEEVSYLMDVFFKTLKTQTKDLNKYNIRLRIIGDLTFLNKKLYDRIKKSEQTTVGNSGLQLNVAISYSGRWDILQAAKQVSQQVATGCITQDQITEEYFASFLCLHDLPEPDLFIRTSGEQRLSNFLLWQLAYTELYFTDIFWPDFDVTAFNKALIVFTKRERRFGFTSEQVHV